MENNKSHGQINVIADQAFKQRLEDITITCSEIVGATLGPYGKNTILQTMDGVIKTKDGWNVLKGLKFNNIIDNSIKGVIEEIASQVVLKVGDGSTTSVVAAAIMNKLLGNFLSTQATTLSTRELDTILREAVSIIIAELENMSTKIEEDKVEEFMKKIAMVSTNWDEPTSDMIASIIAKTNNPIIKTEYSGTDSTEIIITEDSFDVSGELVEKLFINDNETSSCGLDDPHVLIFDHTVREDYIPMLIQYLIAKSGNAVKGLVVLAPEFSDVFKTQYNNYLMNSLKQTRGIPMLVPAKYIRATNFDRLCIKDFALMCGGSLITKTDDLTKLVKDLASQQPADESLPQMIDILDNHVGEVGNIVITNKLITISNFTNRNEEEYKRVLAVASNGLGEKLKESTALSMLTEDVKLRKFRVGKLQCRMGTIKLGGFGQADLKAKKDALDDAIRACESAFYNGYNIGSSMAVPTACVKVFNYSKYDKLTNDIIKLIGETFELVFTRILNNKCMIPKDQVDDIIANCIGKGVGYNIITDTYDTDKDIINPTTTDIEVLKGMLNMVLLNFTSNQFLFTHFDELQ